MTKKILALMLSMAICVGTFSGCKKENVTAESESVSSDNTNIISRENKNSIVYVNGIPISYVVDGEQLSPNSFLRHTDLSREIPEFKYAPTPDSLPKKNANSMFTNDTKITPTNFYHGSSSNPPELFNSIYTNSEWDLFPIKVQYDKYTISNQPSKEVWNNYFREQLDEISTTTPVVITDVWSFEIGSKKYDIVNAGNMFKTQNADFISDGTTLEASSPPVFDNTIVYQSSTIFITDDQTTSTYDLRPIQNNYTVINKSTTERTYSYLQNPECSGVEVEDFYAVQYNKSNQLTSCQLYDNSYMFENFFAMYSYNFAYLLCDLDGSGKVQLVADLSAHSTSYAATQIYAFQGDKLLLR